MPRWIPKAQQGDKIEAQERGKSDSVEVRNPDLSFEVQVARQESLLMGLRGILRALELPELGNHSNMVAWQTLGGRTVYVSFERISR